MSRNIRRILLLLCTVILTTGCQSEKEVNNTVETKGEKKQNKEKEERTFSFVDVLGESYEAPLLEDIPKKEYDYDRLIDKGGYKYYTDKDGNVISKLGIDVSEYQPSVDWQQVKNAGIEFVMVRMGYRGYGEAGTLVVDKMFRHHVENALGAGLGVGVYFFSQAVNDAEVKEEAEFVLENIKDYNLTYPVVFDTEEIKFDTARTDNLTSEQFTRNCEVFCDVIQAAGYDTMIYANMKWFAFTLDLTKLTDYPKWYADYEPIPQCPYEFDMWQYTESGSVPGIDGNVDLNVYFPQDEKLR